MNSYLSPSLTPPYPPTTLDVGRFGNFAGQGYLWAYYQTPPSSWGKINIEGTDILGFFLVNGEQTLREILASQMKPTLKINQAVFYIYELPSGGGGELRVSDENYAMNKIPLSISYAFLQLAKYRNYDTRDKMRGNLIKMMAFFTAVNSKVKGAKFSPSEFNRLGVDNDFTEAMTTVVTFRGLFHSPFFGC